MVESELNALIKDCLKHHRQSQQLLFKHFYNYVMTIAHRYAPNPTDAEEIVSDTFYKVFSRIETYNPDYPFKPWIGRITVNCAINHFRKYHNREVFLENIDSAQHIEHEEDIISKLSYEELKNMIQTLTPAYRAVFNLYVIEGYKHDEIAAMLHISEGASKSNLSRAKQKMQRMIAVLNKE